MNALNYTVPSRLAINLYDMNGNLGRVDGGIGFSIDYPRLRFQAEQYSEIYVENLGLLGNELASAVTNTLELVQFEYNLGGIKLHLLEGIPAHSGFGSKTATLLSIAHAFGKIYNYDFDYKQLGIFLNRGGTSGLGINLIDKGGFILEGGHSTKDKPYFMPSSESKSIRPSPILARLEMPDWDVLLVLPNTERVFGDKEIKFFKDLCPLPEADIEYVARITLSQVLPGIVEKDIDAFSDGINGIQKRGWKKHEIDLYGDTVSSLMTYLTATGIKGVGMSSIGPCLFGFGQNLNNVVEHIKHRVEGVVMLTKPNNSGINIKNLK